MAAIIGSSNFNEMLEGTPNEDNELVSRITSSHLQLVDHFDNYHTKLLENFNLLSGNLLSEADLSKLKKERRPDFQYNFFLPIILRIVGDFKRSMPDLEITGTTQEDYPKGKIIYDLNHHILYQQNNIIYEISKAFLFAVAARIGWLVQDFVINEKYPKGKIQVRWEDPLKLRWDPDWNRRETDEMMFMDSCTFYSYEELISVYAMNKPELAEEIREKANKILGRSYRDEDKSKGKIATWSERVLNFFQDAGGDRQGYDYQSERMRKSRAEEFISAAGRFATIDWFEKRETEKMILTDMVTRQTVDITDTVKNSKAGQWDEWYDNDMLQEVKKRYASPYIRETRPLRVYQSSISPALGLKLFDGKQKWQNEKMKYTPIVCYDFHPDQMENKGVIDVIADPIKSANLRRNTMLTYLMRTAHGGWIAEESAVKKFKKSFLSNEVGALRIVEDDALKDKRIQESGVPPFPSALDRIAGEDIEMTQYMTGVTMNRMGGQQSDNESGKLYQERVEQADIMQEWIDENAKFSLVEIAKNNIAMTKAHLTEYQVLQILKNDLEPYWIEINKPTIHGIYNDVTDGEFNVSISSMPKGRYAEEREFQKALRLAQFLGQYSPELVDLESLIETSGVHNKQKWLQRLKMFKQKEMEILNQQQAEQNMELQQKDEQHQNEMQRKKLENRQLINELAMDDMIKTFIGV